MNKKILIGYFGLSTAYIMMLLGGLTLQPLSIGSYLLVMVGIFVLLISLAFVICTNGEKEGCAEIRQARSEIKCCLEIQLESRIDPSN